jgi:hypothetical protein
MDIKFIRSPLHLGYAYRAGDTTGSLPDEIAKILVSDGYAVPLISERPKRLDPEVHTTQIKRRKKNEV